VRTLLLERASHAVAFAALSAGAAWLQVYAVVADQPGHPYLSTAVEQFSHALVMSVVVVAIIAGVERSRWALLPRVAVQCAALTGGVLGAAAIIASLAGPDAQIVRDGLGSPDALFVHFAWVGFTASTLLSWYYASRERAARASDALARSNIERQRALARIAQSRLEVLRSQLDPDSIDASLADIEARYARDTHEADRRLDVLIDQLCAALRVSRPSNS
jgi:hypothetical protein